MEEEKKNTEEIKEEAAVPQTFDEQPGTTEIKSEADKKAALKKDKSYRKGRLLYDIGTWFMTLYLLLFAARQLLHIELVLGGTFVSSYLSFLFIIPLLLMITGMIISDKAAKRMDVKENNKLWTGVLSAVGILLIVLSICEILMPSYKVYNLISVNHNNNPSINEGQEFLVAEYRTGTILSPAPSEKPGHIFLDVYSNYGIIAVKKQSAANNNGTFDIKSKGNGGNDYLLIVRSLGREESFPFSY